ncbi:MAG: U32 family peptidase [Bacilli bacterium]
MKNKILITVKEVREIEDFKKVGVSTFLFALQDFCVGYEREFSLDEINSIKEENKYILINRVLDCKDVDKLRELLSGELNVKGIVYEDIAVYQIIKSLKKNVQLICFQNHFNSNIKTVNFWLDRVDSVVICNELSKEEIITLLDGVKKDVVLQVYGHNQAMYSRRLLLSNFTNEFHLEPRSTNTLVEKVTGFTFKALENKYGTVLYSGNIFNGLELLSFPKVKYYFINTTFISHKDIMEVLENLSSSKGDRGFLDKETIYKLKEAK